MLEGVAMLAEVDPVMARLVGEQGVPKLSTLKGASRFEQLAESICYQQLAGAAAEAIWRRVRAAVGDEFTPESVLACGYEPLRAAGFSNAKTASVLDLAAKVAAGEVRLDRIGRLTTARRGLVLLAGDHRQPHPTPHELGVVGGAIAPLMTPSSCGERRGQWPLMLTLLVDGPVGASAASISGKWQAT